MANKRMFSMDIVDSDAFIELPQTAQNLYFHLGMRADDDGAIGNARAIRRYIGATEKDMEVLLESRFLLNVDGIIFIKHWRINNYIVPSRHHPTAYQEQLNMLKMKDNKSYTESCKSDNDCSDNCNTNSNPECNTSDTTDDVHESERSESCTTNVIHDAVLEETRLEESRQEENREVSNVHSDEVHKTDSLEDFFESIWELYPVKKGKGQVSKTKKQVLQRVGYEQLKRCVERYSDYMKSRGNPVPDQYWKNGSPFFNSGYVDYLDENYTEESEQNSDVQMFDFSDD